MAVWALCYHFNNATVLKKFLMFAFTLCVIICFISDGVNAGKQWRKNRNNARNRATKRKYPQVFTAGNGVTLPNDVDMEAAETEPRLLDPSKASKTKTHIELKPKKSLSQKPLKKAPRPHIIFVIADDLGYNDVGYHVPGTGCVAHTPNINNLALTGVRLENYYTQSTCSPTRASILTGRYPVSNGRSWVQILDGWLWFLIWVRRFISLLPHSKHV